METQVKSDRWFKPTIGLFPYILQKPNSSCAHAQSTSEIPLILHSGSSIPIQSSSIRTNNKSLCLYSTDHCNSHSIEKEGNNSVSISGQLVNSSHAVRDLGRVRQYPPWLLFAAFFDSVGYPRSNPQKTRKQWRTRDRRFHWLWGWFPNLKIIFMM